jgi:hypothetical protein
MVGPYYYLVSAIIWRQREGLQFQLNSSNFTSLCIPLLSFQTSLSLSKSTQLRQTFLHLIAHLYYRNHLFLSHSRTFSLNVSIKLHRKR